MSIALDAVAIALRRLSGVDPGELLALEGGASDRWYLRLVGPLAARQGAESLIVMGIAPRLRAIFDAYLGIRRFLERKGLPVPRVFGEWPADGLVLLEDFGDTTMTRALADWPDDAGLLYDRAIALLARLHACAEDPGDPSPAFHLSFDVEKFQYEFGFHVKTWLIERHWQVEPTPAEREALELAFAWIPERLAAQPRVFTHRDYQSSNLMVRADGSLGVIDFQDARQGLRQYDLASLAWDSYVCLDDAARARMVGAYLRQVPLDAAALPEECDLLLRLAAIQRKLHDAGAFVYAAAHRGKRSFLRFIPDAVATATGLMAGIAECRAAGTILDDYAGRAARGSPAERP